MKSGISNYIQPLHVAIVGFFVMFALVTVESKAQIAIYKVAVRDSTVFVSEPVQVIWLAPHNRTSDDVRVAIYTQGSSREIDEVRVAPSEEFGYPNFYIEKEGRYEVRMYIDGDDDKVVARVGNIIVAEDEGAHVFSSTFGIELVDDDVVTGELVAIEWKVPTESRNRSFWIGFYEDEDDEDDEYDFYESVNPDGETRGVHYFVADDPELYEEVRMFSRGYNRVDIADDELDIDRGTPSSSMRGFELSFEDTRVDEGDSFEISYERPRGRVAEYDWIGIYEVGARDRSYEMWEYVGRAESGEVRFRMDEPGEYEARLFLDNGYSRVAATGNTITVK